MAFLEGDTMEIELETKFDIAEDQMEFTTQSNGDRMRINNVHLSPESAAALAHMVNCGCVIEVLMKPK
jgi:hypothetical protein